MPHVKIGSQRLHYEDTGGGQPAIIFCHAFGMTGSMFAPQIAAFIGTYRCITWDERGHGGSPAHAPFDFWDSARDAVALLDHLGIERAFFVGTSQGGFVSLRAALLAPERVRALAVLGSSAASEQAAQRAAYTKMHDAFMASGSAGAPREVLNALAHICLGPHFNAEPSKRLWSAWPREQCALAFQALIGRDDIKGRLREISAPTLVLHGSADDSFAPIHGQIIAAGVANLEGFILVEDGAHFLSLTDPMPVNAALGAFLKKFR